jgi:hypothetical protein
MNKDVHTEHCCIDHGCKYGNKFCTVASEEKEQSHSCEQCDLDDELIAEAARILKDRKYHRKKEIPASVDDVVPNVMPKINGKSFRCDCGCNVFCQTSETEIEIRYTCNACGDRWVGERDSSGTQKKDLTTDES